MREPDDFEIQEIQRLKLLFYLIPVIGMLPACLTLSSRKGSAYERNLSRLVVTLASAWLLGHALLEFGAQASDSLSLPLLITSSLLTSGYFAINVGLMIYLLQRKPLRLPLISNLADRLP